MRRHDHGMSGWVGGHLSTTSRCGPGTGVIDVCNRMQQMISRGCRARLPIFCGQNASVAFHVVGAMVPSRSFHHHPAASHVSLQYSEIRTKSWGINYELRLIAPAYLYACQTARSPHRFVASPSSRDGRTARYSRRGV